MMFSRSSVCKLVSTRWQGHLLRCLAQDSWNADSLVPPPQQRFSSNAPTKPHRRRPRTSSPSPVSSLSLEQQQQQQQPPSSPSFTDPGTDDRPSLHELTERIVAQEQELLQTVAEYRDVWYDRNIDDDVDNTNIPFHWKQATQFQHPTTTSTTVAQLQASERAYRKLCSLCHDLVIATCNFPHPTLQEQEQQQQKDKLPFHSEWMGFLLGMLRFWEVLRQERLTIAKQHDYIYTPPPAPPLEEISPKSDWTEWISSIVGINKLRATAVVEPSPEQDPYFLEETEKEENNEALAPGMYHYTKVIGKLYFHYPQPPQHTDDGHDDEWLQDRALLIQSVLDHAPRPSVMANKSVRLLIRAYQDMGTMESAHQAEQVYRNFPDHHKGLLWYVLKGYQTLTHSSPSTTTTTTPTTTPTTPTKPTNTVAVLAVQRVLELLSEASTNEEASKEFNSWATIAFTCLGNIEPDALDKYYERVEALAKLKFGPATWKELKQPTGDKKIADLSLQPNDFKTLHLLVQLYGRDDDHWELARNLFETTWKRYPLGELHISLQQTTLNTLMKTLLERKKKRGNVSNEEFEFALGLVPRMALANIVWPVEKTWIWLLQLARDGPDAERVWKQFELCRSRSPPASPAKLARYALYKWVVSAEEGNPDAPREAQRLLDALRVQSTPLLLDPTKDAEALAKIYDAESRPDQGVYANVLKVVQAARTTDITERMQVAFHAYECAKKQQLYFSAKMYIEFLRVFGLHPDKARRLAMSRELYEQALGEGKLSRPFLKDLERLNPDLHREHVENEASDESDDEEEDDD